MHFVISKRVVRENSFLNFHVFGFDYLCVGKVNEWITKKLYFYLGDGSVPVVNPHDHRYSFRQTVLHGECTNFLYEESQNESIPEYSRYFYRTPLNGGNGFEFDRKVRLRCTSQENYYKGDSWTELYNEIHTIKCKSGTIMLQEPTPDVIREAPTKFYTLEDAPPESHPNMYRKPTDAEIFVLLNMLSDAGHSFEMV